MAASALLGAPAAAAQSCPQKRPTDPSGGLLHYTDPAGVTFHDANDVRVWYATDGPDAVAPSPTGSSGAPENVELVGAILDDALAQFTSWGFEPPLGDGDYDACASNGGDGRLDIYLIDFPTGADGAAQTDSCTNGVTVTCSGFMLLDSSLSHYDSFEEGVRVVGPHELFHLVQNAYAANDDAWWGEGTAQWAADRIHPELDDLEGFLPYFFAEPNRPLDLSGGGVTNAWLYATAIWPVFLEQYYGADAVLAVFQQSAQGIAPVLDATEAALAAEGGVAAAYAAFASYNAATGDRAADGQGYLAAASYPMLELTPLPDGLGHLHDGILAGLSAHYFLSQSARQLTLTGDPERVTALAIPLQDGRALVDERVPLPANVTTPAIVVVAGQRTGKVDVPFAIGAAELQPEPQPQPPTEALPPGSDGGCAAGGERRTSGGALLVALALFGVRARRRRVARHSDARKL